MERDDRREAAYCEAGWSLCHLLSGEAVDSHVEPPTSQRRGTRARGLLVRGVTVRTTISLRWNPLSRLGKC